MVEFIKVIIIAIVEGITEWLPISSTGHMLLVDAIIPLNMSEEYKEMFFVVIQLGAILAVVVMFWSKMWPIKSIENKLRLDMNSINMWLKVIVATIPAGILGLLLDDWLEANFGTPIIIAIMLILYGIFFIIIERWNKGRTPKIEQLSDITYATALAIGMFQVLSMIPGTSRSGATIVGALLIGVSRVAAAEFTFFLAVPVMFGASFLKLVKFGFDFTAFELFLLLLGMVVAFAVSVVVIRFLMGYIKKHDFQVFGWYRIVIGIVVIVYFSFIR